MGMYVPSSHDVVAFSARSRCLPPHQVQAEPAVCPLVYADLFITTTGSGADSTDQTATSGSTSATPGRADHIATQGRCGAKIEKLTAREEGGRAGEDVGGDISGDLGPPFLVIFNFQVRQLMRQLTWRFPHPHETFSVSDPL